MTIAMTGYNITLPQVLSYATIVRYLVYQQGKEIDLLVGTLRDHGIGTFSRSPQYALSAISKPLIFLPVSALAASTRRCKTPSPSCMCGLRACCVVSWRTTFRVMCVSPSVAIHHVHGCSHDLVT